LVGLCLLLGLGEALAAFFLDRVRFESGPLWLGELGATALFGTLAVALLVFVLGLLLMGTGRALGGKTPSSGWRAAAGRLGQLPTVALVYLLIRFVVSGNFVAYRIVGGVLIGALIALYLVRGLPAALRRLERFWPLLVGVLAAADTWYATGNLVRKRFEAGESAMALFHAAVPLVLIGAAWLLVARRRGWIRAVAVAVAVVLGAGFLLLHRPAAVKPAAGDRPDIVFVVVDTLRADRVWGELGAMPRIEQLAGQGVYYTQAFTPIPKTQQSVASFHTGLYPWTNEVRTLKAVLGAEHDTIAEKLARAGYRTAAFVHNPWIDYGMGHEQGFHEYHDYYKVESFSYLLHATLPIALLDHTVGRKRGAYKFQVDGARLTDRLVSWLESPPKQPFFLWIHYFDPHWPYLPPADTPNVDAADFETAGPVNGMRGHSQRGINIFHAEKGGITDAQVAAASRLYAGEARYSDRLIAEILERFEGREPPLVLFTSDHGESLGEHGYHFHHGAFTYDVCLKVPLLLSWPGHLPGGRVVDEPVMTVDILPTLTSLAGVEPGRVDGVVLPVADGSASGDPGRVIPFESDVRLFEANDRIHLPGVKGKWRGVVAENRKLIAVPREKDIAYQLYDLAADPAEVDDLYAAQSDAATPWIGALEEAGLAPGSAIDQVGDDAGYELDPEEVERLRSLGYLQ
jgi:arylsulfatase